MVTLQTEIKKTDIYLRKVMYSVYDGKCFYTGRQIEFEDMHIDHILPIATGGKNCIENYVLTCGYINIKKTDKTDNLFVERVSLINKMLFSEKVVSEYNNLVLNAQIGEGMININDFLRVKNLNTHPKRYTFVQSAKRNLPYTEYRPLASVQYGRTGLSTKKRFYFDKSLLQIYFDKFKFIEQPALAGALKRKKRLNIAIDNIFEAPTL